MQVPESVEFYYRDGTPAPRGDSGKNGILGLLGFQSGQGTPLPSVVTILRKITREGLERWDNVGFVRTLNRVRRRRNEGDDAFVSRGLAKYERLRRSEAIFSERVHAACELWVRSGLLPRDKELLEPVKAFAEWWREYGWTGVSQNEIILHNEYADRVDFIAQHPEYGECLINLSTQRTRFDKFEFYVGMAARLAAAARARKIKEGVEPRVVSVVLSSTNPGKLKVKFWTRSEQQKYFAFFESAKALWTHENGATNRAKAPAA